MTAEAIFNGKKSQFSSTSPPAARPAPPLGPRPSATPPPPRGCRRAGRGRSRAARPLSPIRRRRGQPGPPGPACARAAPPARPGPLRSAAPPPAPAPAPRSSSRLSPEPHRASAQDEPPALPRLLASQTGDTAVRDGIVPAQQGGCQKHFPASDKQSGLGRPPAGD